MNELLQAIYVIILTLNLFALGSGRILSVIRIIAVQGILLGFLPLLLHAQFSFPIILSAIVTMLLKGVIIPKIMIKALRDVHIKREVEPIIGILASTIIGAIGTAFIFLIFRRVNSAVQLEIVTMLPTAFATILIGFILLTTRVKALSQVLGYLVLENGIYLFSMLLFEAIPLVVEMGMLLDLFVSIFIISIITNHINRAFSSLDTRKLAALKE